MQRSRRTAVTLVLLGSLASVAAAGSARAQGASDAASAQTLFDQGRALMTAGNFAEACPKLAASQHLDPGAGTLMNLAACYEKNGQTASAWATYLDAVPASRSSGHADWEAHAKERAAALEPTLSRLTITVPPENDVPGLHIERDGKEVLRAEWGTAIPVDPGAHPVVATAPQTQQWSTTAAVGPNAAKVSVTIPKLALEQANANPAPTPPPAVAPVAPPPSRPPENDGSTQRIVGIVIGAAGIVALGVGTAFGLMAKSTYNSAFSDCQASDDRCTSAGVSGVSQAQSQATIASVLFPVGAVALVGGAVVYFTAPKGAPAGGVGLRVVPTPGGGAMSLGGAW